MAFRKLATHLFAPAAPDDQRVFHSVVDNVTQANWLLAGLTEADPDTLTWNLKVRRALFAKHPHAWSEVIPEIADLGDWSLVSSPVSPNDFGCLPHQTLLLLSDHANSLLTLLAKFQEENALFISFGSKIPSAIQGFENYYLGLHTDANDRAKLIAARKAGATLLTIEELDYRPGAEGLLHTLAPALTRSRPTFLVIEPSAFIRPFSGERGPLQGLEPRHFLPVLDVLNARLSIKFVGLCASPSALDPAEASAELAALAIHRLLYSPRRSR